MRFPAIPYLALAIAVAWALMTRGLVEAQVESCAPTTPYQVSGQPGVWALNPLTNRHQVVIAVPGSTQYSDSDGFGGWLLSDIPSNVVKIREWLSAGKLDYMGHCGSKVKKVLLPEIYQPTPHTYTFYYNFLREIDESSSKLCSFVDAVLEGLPNSSPTEVLLVSMGYGASVVLNAQKLGCLKRHPRPEVTINHFASYNWPFDQNSVQMQGYSPPATIPYPFEKFDVYHGFELNSQQSLTLRNVARNASSYGGIWMWDMSPWVQLMVDGGLAQQSFSGLENDYPFRYKLSGILDPKGVAYRYYWGMLLAFRFIATGWRYIICPASDCDIDVDVNNTRFSSYQEFYNFLSLHPDLRASMETDLPTYAREGYGNSNDSAVCGDRKIEGSEACDPPDNKGCNGLCQKIKCGDSNVEGEEECDPPKQGSCDSNCKKVIKCGNNKKEKGEECDGNGTPCNALKPPLGKTFSGSCTNSCHCEVNPSPTPTPEAAQLPSM